jgi:hypothetical protein
MKTLIAILLMAAGMVHAAENYIVQDCTLPVSSIGATSNAVLNAIIDTGGQDPFQVLFQFVAVTNAATDNQTVTIDASIDRANWLSLGTVSIAADGTNTVTAVTNLATGNFRYIRMTSWTNEIQEAGDTITNIVIRYGTVRKD